MFCAVCWFLAEACIALILWGFMNTQRNHTKPRKSRKSQATDLIATSNNDSSLLSSYDYKSEQSINDQEDHHKIQRQTELGNEGKESELANDHAETSLNSAGFG
jgi:hypothetical protein